MLNWKRTRSCCRGPHIILGSLAGAMESARHVRAAIIARPAGRGSIVLASYLMWKMGLAGMTLDTFIDTVRVRLIRRVRDRGDGEPGGYWPWFIVSLWRCVLLERTACSARASYRSPRRCA